MVFTSIAAVVLAVLAAATAAAPLLLQQPFGSQTATGMWIAHLTRTWGSPLTIALAVATIALVLMASRRARWWGRALFVVPVALALAGAWLARENPFEWWFNRLAAPSFVNADRATFVEPGDVVLAVSSDGASAAYPVRLIAYHHIVNDRIGKTPAVVTY